MYKHDCVIVGGGIAGLWLLSELRRMGVDAWLLEKKSIGCGQTLASQGIIHGGIKYSLGGIVSSETKAISAMPQRWSKHFQNLQEPHLSKVQILERWQYLLIESGIKGNMLRLFTSKAMASSVAEINIDSLQLSKKMIGLRLEENVLDVRSLLQVLYKPISDYCRQYKVHSKDINTDVANWKIIVNGELIEPRLLVFAAGEGNENFINNNAMQLRPLHMVYVRHKDLFPIHAHIIGVSNKPIYTISSHYDRGGNLVWYIGGELAETGVGLPSRQQNLRVQKALQMLWGQIDWDNGEWSSIIIQRAEHQTNGFIKPEKPSLIQCADNAVAIFPTKLAFTPLLVDEILATYQLTNKKTTRVVSPLTHLPHAVLGEYRWY